MRQAPIKQLITIDDIDKLDIRAGLILSVNEIAGSDKLMKLIVNLGDHRRSILAGIRKERPDPTEIEGLQALYQ